MTPPKALTSEGLRTSNLCRTQSSAQLVVEGLRRDVREELVASSGLFDLQKAIQGANGAEVPPLAAHMRPRGSRGVLSVLATVVAPGDYAVREDHLLADPQPTVNPDSAEADGEALGGDPEEHPIC